MKKNFFLLFTLFTAISFAQTKPKTPNQRVIQEKNAGALFETVNLFNSVVKSKVSELVPSEFKEYTIFSFDKSQLASFKSNAPTTINLSIPGQKSEMSLELVRARITTNDYQIIEMPSGKTIKPDDQLVHYTGIVKGEPNSVVAISFFNDEISGIISFGKESSNLVIGKLKNSSNQIIYRDNDISHLNNFACQALDNPEKESTQKQFSGNSLEKAARKSPKIFFDIANDIVKDKGGVQGASNYIEALFNQVAVLYANDNISIRLSGIKAWTSTAPFSNDLNKYREYRNKNSFNGDLGHLVTYNYSGGLAWVNGLCGSYKYGVSGIHKSFKNVPTYSWSVLVVAHELGHNLGSPHTQDCKWNNNNTAIDGCVDTVGGCAKPGIPSGGGTIMSYCHVTSAGTNFNKGFGPQPKALIISTINSKGCVENIQNPNCNWSKKPGNGTDIGAGSNKVYVVGTNKSIYRWNNSNWIRMSGVTAKRIDVAYGSPYIVTDKNEIYRNLSNTRWTKVPGKAFDIGGNHNTLVHIGNGNNIYSYAGGGKWNLLPGNGKGIRIDVANDGNPWIVGTNNNIYQYIGSTNKWSKKGDFKASDISISREGDVWALQLNSGIPHKYKGSGVWEKFNGILTNISVQDNGHLWGVNKNTKIYENTCVSTANIIEAPIVSALETDEVKIYPNPAKDILNIELNSQNDIFNLDISDINGKILQTHLIDTNPNTNTTKSLDVSELTTGIYFVKMKGEKKIITHKIFIE